MVYAIPLPLALNWHFELKNEFSDLRAPHASTVHKSQGSTYQYCFVDLSDIGRNTRWEEIARLVYVALTRASHTVLVTGALPERVYGVNGGEVLA